MSDKELEWEQRKTEKLYGDRIEKFDEANYTSGEELEKGALEILEQYMKTGKIK
ncbi:MAG: hypothetical protein KBT36_17745 [Kurthia sp.]|nr:hypothetical protein [Candidatus Kurthia equi]